MVSKVIASCSFIHVNFRIHVIIDQKPQGVTLFILLCGRIYILSTDELFRQVMGKTCNLVRIYHLPNNKL